MSDDDDSGFTEFAEGWNQTVSGWGDDIAGFAKQIAGKVIGDEELMLEGVVQDDEGDGQTERGHNLIGRRYQRDARPRRTTETNRLTVARVRVLRTARVAAADPAPPSRPTTICRPPRTTLRTPGPSSACYLSSTISLLLPNRWAACFGPTVRLSDGIDAEVVPVRLAQPHCSIGRGVVVAGERNLRVGGPPVPVERPLQPAYRAGVHLVDVQLGQQDAQRVRHAFRPVAQRGTGVDHDAAAPVGGMGVVPLEMQMEADGELARVADLADLLAGHDPLVRTHPVGHVRVEVLGAVVIEDRQLLGPERTGRSRRAS